MSEKNKLLARRFIAAFAAGDRSTLERIVAINLIDHNAPPGLPAGRQGLIDIVMTYRAAFPDMTMTIENQVAEDDCVVLNGHVKGTNTGALRGTPATGKAATFAYMDMYRISNDVIVEMWHVEDIAGMRQQLGLMPGR